MQFNDSLISKLEGLAKLKFDTNERVKISQDLEKMLHMVNTLQNIDTDNVEPLVHLNESTQSTREDEVQGQLLKKEALANAPQKNDDFITIPKVIDL